MFPLRLAVMVTVLGTLALAAGSALPGVQAPSTAAADDAPSNQHTCSGGFKTPDPAPLVPPVVQTCTVTAASGYCIQRSTAQVVEQTCIFTQTGTRTTGYAIQVNTPRGQMGTQDAEQVIDVTQNSTGATGSASFTYTQRVEQEQNAGSGGGDDDDDDEGPSGPPAALIDQNQQSHQTVDLDQTTVSGSILGTGVQRLDQEQRAANALDIQQRQNADAEFNPCDFLGGFGNVFDDPFANQCATFDQTSTGVPGGRVTATPDQRYTQFQRASDATTGKQVQGVEFDPTSGGLDLRFLQSSTGVALWDSDQNENQTQQRDNTGTMIWVQHGPMRKGSGDQNSNLNNVVRIDQDSVQFSGTGCGGGDDDDDGDDGDDEGDDDDESSCEPDFTGEQTTVLTAMAETSGECIATLTATQNGESESASEPGNDPGSPDFCDEFIACGDVGLYPGGGGSLLAPEAFVILQAPNCFSSDDEIDLE